MFKLNVIGAIFVVIASLLISSCSAPYKPSWKQEGVSADMTFRDLSKCRYDVAVAKISRQEGSQVVIDCMHSKGYRYY